MAIDPKMIQLAASMLANKKEEVNQNLEDSIDRSKNTLTNVGGFLGDSMLMAANNPDNIADPQTGAFGGAISGAAKGMSAGPLGALGGALLGGLSGYITTGYTREAQENSERDSIEDMLMSDTVSPDIMYAEEGGAMEVISNSDLAPVQMEKGEMILFGELDLVKSKSKATHDEMDDDDVTDIVPTDAYVFSSSDKYLFNKEKDVSEADDVLGYMPVKYSDSDKTSMKETDKIKFTDILSKDEMTFADIAKDIKKKFSTSDRKYDIFTEVTNAANKRSRLPYLQKAIHFQEKKTGRVVVDGDEKEPSLEDAGEYTPKFQGGGPVSTIINLSRSLERASEDTSAKPMESMSEEERAFFFANSLAKNLMQRGYRVTPAGNVVDRDGNKVSSEEKNEVAKSMGANSKEQIDSMFQELGSFINDNAKLNEANRDLQMRKASKLFSRMSGRNLAGLGVSSLGIGVQSPYEDAVILDNADIGEMFQDVPRSVIQNQVDNAQRNVRAAALSATDQGFGTTRTANALAAASSRAEKLAADIESKYNLDRVQNRRNRAATVQQRRDANETAIVNQSNQIRDNVNTQISEMASIANRYFTSANQIDAQREMYENRIDAEYNANRQTNMQNRIQTGISELGLNIQEEDLSKRRGMLEDFYDFQKQNAQRLRDEQEEFARKREEFKNRPGAVKLLDPIFRPENIKSQNLSINDLGSTTISEDVDLGIYNPGINNFGNDQVYPRDPIITPEEDFLNEDTFNNLIDAGIDPFGVRIKGRSSIKRNRYQ